MNRFLILVFLLLAGASPARAEPIAIAQMPLLNISGSGSVKPNLMLLYDNSGSMNYNYTPDYVNTNTTCRSRATIGGGRKSCRIGDAPFSSPDFNRQYYNPKVRYSPPLKADGSSYPNLDAGQTSNWTAVSTDAFGVNQTDHLGNEDKTNNLVSKFIDSQYCDRNDRNCARNSSGYTYPSNDRYNQQYVYSNPYYYTINVAEYCRDANLTDCRAASANGASPGGVYTYPARVRFCDSTNLGNCQAKYVGDYKYPRFGPDNQVSPWYATITIASSSGNVMRVIDSVSAVGAGGTEVITNGRVLASSGTDTEAKRRALANELARSIIARTGLARPWAACVLSPTTSDVPKCATLGIELGSTDMVALLPVACADANSAKSTCTTVEDNTRAGETLVVASGSGATALLRISGTTNGSKNQIINGLRLGNTWLLSNAETFERSKNATWIANFLVGKIGTRGTIKAYVGGDPVSPLCDDEPASTVCLVDSSGNAEGASITLSSLSNNTCSSRSCVSLTQQEGVTDVVSTSTTGTGASVFVRTDIVPERTVYPRAPSRTDCDGNSCTYAQEMTNFANWFAYYKTRNQMMKTAVGQAFAQLTDKYNVGLVALSVAADEGTMKRPLPFAGDDRGDWYKRLYAMNTSGATPVRQALHAIGKMYANQKPYAQKAGEEVVRYACQQNFTFITTDGYWNGDAAVGVASSDNKEDPARFCLQTKGCVDDRDQSVASLADVALYWYNGGTAEGTTSLRPGLEDWSALGAVPAGPGENRRLHMKTYALGLGVDGIMNYEPNYDTAPLDNGDFHKLINRVAKGCPWNGGGRYTWPDPETGVSSGSAAYQSRVDDLWHAAINGHGKYFSASDPTQVIDSLRSALSKIEATTGAAAAAATSTPNISQNDNDIFSATFTTVQWTGRLSKRKVDIATGEVEPAEIWNTSDTLGKKVDAREDERTIYMANGSGALVQFAYANLSATEKGWFDNKCSLLTQCASLSSANRAIVNDGASIVGWLRGRQQYADDTVLRAFSRTVAGENNSTPSLPVVLGDIASSKPAYLREPRRNFDREGYSAYKVAHAGRKPTVFAAANDGMLHAFDADNGDELWSYVPRITMKKLYQLASTTYGTNHIFSVDGSPEIADVQIGGEWKTVLVAGLNAGGRGYYALDVTDPEAPRALWELCADASVCGGSRREEQLGLTFGNPQFGTIKNSDGSEKWVVFLTSGYNNIPGTDGIDSGDGKGYLLMVDVATGEVLRKTSTSVGSTATPSGLGKITAITKDPNNDPLVTYVYGGDNTGKMWRFDLTVAGTTSVLQMGDAGVDQPFTTRPEVTMCRVESEDEEGRVTASAQRVVVFGSGRLLDLVDIASTARQSAYVIKDSGEAISSAAWRKSPAMVKKTLTRVPKKEGDSADDAASRPYTIAGAEVDLASQRGWFVDFDINRGERVNLDPKVVAGTVNVVTNLPSSSTECRVGGTSNMYQLNVCTGKAASPDGIAGYPLASSAAVGFIVIRLPSGALKTITTTADGSMVTGKFPPSETSGAQRSGWRRVRE